ncbi:LBP_cg2779 family protein [uncultured Lactobacillus sp.]|uniref:LBP_cg2779 family protein n=1 Tax=uncultured Lactobacillus sp. TaxID=153152 RepID=UPI002666486A|nr:LBP_cg2779 family protein [uncultured Lactobacillus sp.]
MKPEELSDAIIEFQGKHSVSDTALAFSSHLSVEKVHAMKAGHGNFTNDEVNQMLDYIQSQI